MDELQDIRSQIDSVDARLMALLGERFRLTERMGAYKAKHGLTARDPAREDAQAARIAELARRHGVDPTFAARLLRVIIDEVVAGHEAKRRAT